MTFEPAFFEISAQLIPVLFLAMVVEDKLRDPDTETWWDRVMRSWVLVLLFWCEVACLGVVAGVWEVTRALSNLTAACMGFAGFLLLIPVLNRAITTGRKRREQLGHGAAALVLVVGVVVLMFRIGF